MTVFLFNTPRSSWVEVVARNEKLQMNSQHFFLHINEACFKALEKMNYKALFGVSVVVPDSVEGTKELLEEMKIGSPMGNDALCAPYVSRPC